jgi:hypothetical protein
LKTEYSGGNIDENLVYCALLFKKITASKLISKEDKTNELPRGKLRVIFHGKPPEWNLSD